MSACIALRAYLQLCATNHTALAALQETRLKNLAFRDDQYMIRSHPAQRGHGGVMLALNPWLFKLKDGNGQIQQLQEDQWTVVASSHGFILTRLWAGPIDVFIANLHVPHSGHADDEISKFWHEFQQIVPPHLRDKEMILMGDFNARVGSTTSKAIGGLGAEDEIFAGGLLHEFLLRAGLFLTATFDGIHSGPTRTWIHPNGAVARLDYRAIPLRWATPKLHTWTDFGLQAHQHLHDHQATCMQIQAVLRGEPELVRCRRTPRGKGSNLDKVLS